MTTSKVYGRIVILVSCALFVAFGAARAKETNPRTDALSPDVWRREHRLFDLHTHVEGLPERYERAMLIMDAVGIGGAVELGSGTVTPSKDGTSEFTKAQEISAKVCPSRFVHYMLLDYKGWDESDWSVKAVEQIYDGHRRGAPGLTEFKRLGLLLRDG